MIQPLPPPRHAGAGFTLIELVIAIAILGIGTLAALRVIDQSRRAVGEEAARFLARSVALNRAEEIRLYGSSGRSLPGTMTQGGRDFRVTTTVLPTEAGLVELTISVTTTGGPGARVVAYALPAGLSRP